MNEIEDNIPLAELFNLNPDDYADISVESLTFSVRILNRLREKRIETIRDLLLVDIGFLKKLRGFGARSLAEILSYCEGLTKSEYQDEILLMVSLSPVFKEFRASIVKGNFTIIDDLPLSELQKRQLNLLKKAYAVLGNDLAIECVYSPQKVAPIISMLSSYGNRYTRLILLERIVAQIPAFRLYNKARYYIDVYSKDENTRKKLSQCYSSTDDHLGEIINTIDIENDAIVLMAKNFLEWCAFDLREEIEGLFNAILSPRIKEVLEGRANNQTLNELGEQLGLTRERVRQIEAKGKRLFNRHLSRVRILSKLYADLNGSTIIKIEDIEEVSGNNAAVLIYLLKDTCGGLYTYDYQLDAFFYGENDLPSRIQDYIDTLPEVIKKDDVPTILETARDEYDLDIEYVEKALFDTYKVTGDILHRSRLSLAKIYLEIVRKYFPKGIHVYDDSEINKLREYISLEYGNINLPSANHAIAVRISDICILAGRGRYIPKKEKYISTKLEKKLLSFIMESNSPVLLISNIYGVFEDELQREGIDNRYYLQGVLRELFGDKLYFRRDYISRDKGFTSIYSTIVAYIKSSKYPVKKEEIKRHFKGITDIIITLATSDSEILNYFGEYLHGSNLVIRSSEKEYLSNYLSSVTGDGEAHHIKDIHTTISEERPEIFQRNAAIWPYSAFSVLEYLFRDQYQFERPYIAKKGVEIGSPFERLHEYLYSKDEFSVSDISEFARENRMQIYSLIEYINSINDKYLLLNRNTIVSIEEIGVNISIASIIEMCICDEISETTPIRDLQCISQFPSLNYPWDEWLIYSIINKWSDKLEVALSSSQFKQSIPLVSRIGNMDISDYKNASPIPTNIKIDNMDDIDDLLADIISDELLEDME